MIPAAVVELAYTYVSGTYERKLVRVQVPPAAPLTKTPKRCIIIEQVKFWRKQDKKPQISSYQVTHKKTFLLVIC